MDTAVYGTLLFIFMDGFFNLSTNSILTNLWAKLAKNGGQNLKSFLHILKNKQEYFES